MDYRLSFDCQFVSTVQLNLKDIEIFLNLFDILSFASVDGVDGNQIMCFKVLFLIQNFQALNMPYKFAHSIFELAFFSFLQVQFSEMNVRYQLHFVRDRQNCLKLLLSTIIVATDAQSIRLSNQASAQIFFRIISLSNGIYLFVIDLKAFIVVSVELKESCLTIHFGHCVLKVIKISDQIEFQTGHFLTILLNLPPDVGLRQDSIENLSPPCFNVDIIYSKDVVNIVDYARLAILIDHVSEVKRRLKLSSIRHNCKFECIRTLLQLSVCLFFISVSFDEGSEKDIMSFCFFKPLLLLFSHINNDVYFIIQFLLLEFFCDSFEQIFQCKPNVGQTFGICGVSSKFTHHLPKEAIFEAPFKDQFSFFLACQFHFIFQSKFIDLLLLFGEKMLCQGDKIFLGLSSTIIICVALIIEPVFVEHLCVGINEEYIARCYCEAIFLFQLGECRQQITGILYCLDYLRKMVGVFVASQKDNLINFCLILQVFNIGLGKIRGYDDFDYFVLVHKGHLLLQGFYLRKMINFEIHPQTFEKIFYARISLGVDEVIGNCFSVGKGHLRDVLQEEKVILFGLRVLTSHRQCKIYQKIKF